MSIYKIAELAQVSPSTVSKVINDRGGVSQEVRDRVLQCIEAQNFTPKTAVSDVNNIGVVSKSGDVTGGIFHSNFLIGVMRGVSEYAFEQNHSITLFPSMAIPKNKNQFTLFCRKNRLSGVIFGNLQHNEPYIKEIAGVVPLVTINAEYSGDKVYSISSDDFGGMYNAVQYLHSLGHRRIAIMPNALYYEAHKDRLDGYRKAMNDLQLPIDNEYIMDIDQISPTSICHRFERLKRADSMPTALLTMNDDSAIHIINYLRLIDIHCPRDISIMGYDDYDYSANTSPALSTVKQELNNKGRLAAQIICGGPMENGMAELSEDGFRYVFQTQIVMRDSVKRLA